MFKLYHTKNYLLSFDSGEELGAFTGLQTVMKVNTAAVLKRKYFYSITVQKNILHGHRA